MSQAGGVMLQQRIRYGARERDEKGEQGCQVAPPKSSALVVRSVAWRIPGQLLFRGP